MTNITSIQELNFLNDFQKFTALKIAEYDKKSCKRYITYCERMYNSLCPHCGSEAIKKLVRRSVKKPSKSLNTGYMHFKCLDCKKQF